MKANIIDFENAFTTKFKFRYNFNVINLKLDCMLILQYFMDFLSLWIHIHQVVVGIRQSENQFIIILNFMVYVWLAKSRY